MKTVLIISYYWPPAGGGGVQRWLKMTKYLPENGWRPIIYTPSNGEAPVIDEALMQEIHPKVSMLRRPILEPYTLYKWFTGRKKGERVYSGFISSKKESASQRISIFIRGNFFIPDARMCWIRPSIRFLKKYLQKHPVDAIISTGPPHSMHRIALGVAPVLGIPWIADFRDPWTRIDFYDQLLLSPWADKRHKRMELQVLNQADRVVTVSPSWAEDFRQICGRDDIRVITNGYDPADFEHIAPRTDRRFVICHVGSMNRDRDPHVLWECLSELILEPEWDQNLCIQLIGQVDHSVLESLGKYGLQHRLQHIPFIPHHQVPSYLKAASVLLLPVNDTPNSMGVVPGKLFEYMGAKRPILAIGPPAGDTAAFIRDSGAGYIAGFRDLAKLRTILQQVWAGRENGPESSANPAIMRFSRKVLAADYADLLHELVGEVKHASK